jgi:hypothetical protein
VSELEDVALAADRHRYPRPRSVARSQLVYGFVCPAGCVVDEDELPDVRAVGQGDGVADRRVTVGDGDRALVVVELGVVEEDVDSMRQGSTRSAIG